MHGETLKYVLFVSCLLNLLPTFTVCVDVKIEEIFRGGWGGGGEGKDL